MSQGALTGRPVGDRLGAAAVTDAAALLTLYIVVVLAIPSRLTIGVLGGAGALSTLVGLGALGGWVFLHVARRQPRPEVVQPQRRAVLVFLGAAVLSFVVVARRPGAGEEQWYSQFSILLLCSWVGIMLFASDFLLSWRSIDVLLERVAVATGLYALLGVAQYFSGDSLLGFLSYVPGLSLNQDLVSVTSRDGLNRPGSTAIHAIEFGVALTALLPICLHVLLHAHHLSPARRLFPVLAVAAAIPLCLSRAALVCGAVVLLVLLPTWSARLRRYAVVGLSVMGVVVFVSAPGVLGTLSGLFLRAGSDPSARSRTDSYATAFEFIAQNPLFGRGYGTFLPQYRILDNQYLLLTIEMGVVGLVAYLGVFVTSLVCLRRARRRSRDPVRRHLLQALLASTASVAVGSAFFDGLSFQQYSCVTFLVLGVSAAAWRLVALGAEDRPTPV